MLVDYKGERFRVSERTYEQLQIEYPERAAKLKIIKEAEDYYNLDKLIELIEPSTNKTKETIIKNYIYANDKYEDAVMECNSDDMEKYYGAKEMTRRIGLDLIHYDPEKHPEEIREIEKELEQKEKEYQEWLKNFRESGFVGGK